MALLGETVQAIANAKSSLPVEIRRAHLDKKTLAEAEGRLTATANSLRGKVFGFSYRVDDAAGKIVVSGDADAAKALLDASGVDPSLVTILGAPVAQRASRLSDASPHYGGARLTIFTQVFGACIGECTSAFTVTNVFTVKSMVTAAHCIKSSNNFVISGSHIVGLGVPNPSYPFIDAALVFTGSETFTNHIYTDPGAPTSRTVTAAADTHAGQFVCTDGSFSLAVCSVLVLYKNTVIVDADGITPALDYLVKANSVICQPGDSGGPVYIRTGTANSTITAIITAGTTGTNCWAQAQSLVTDSLGVTITGS